MPDWKREVRGRLAPLKLSPTREADIVDELSQHLEERWREAIAGGASEDEAVRLALAEFRSGNLLARYMAPLRQSQTPGGGTMATPTGNVLGNLWQDLRYAARSCVKRPGFAAPAVLTLALGIGASAAIFAVVNGILLKPLPFAEPDRLVSLVHRAPAVDIDTLHHGAATYFTYRDNLRAFAGIGAWEANDAAITGHGEPEHVDVLTVTHTLLPLLGVQPLVGRLFQPSDDVPNGPQRALLTHGYWQRRFGGAQDAVGRVLHVNGNPVEIIGVLPPSFRFLDSEPAALLPMQLDLAAAADIEFDFEAMARLKPGVTLAEANADVARMIGLLPPAYDVLQMEPDVRPLADRLVGDVRRVLWILLGAVGVVLLIACGNVANLFLVRVEARQQELAMRAALGASRGRLARVLLAESVLMALAGGMLGLALARGAVAVLQAIAPAQLPRVDEIGIDPRVALFTLAISVASGAAFGLLAVLRFGRPHITSLKEGGRGASEGRGRHRTRNALVVAQVALALTLLVVSGLMIRTFVALRQVPPGFTAPETVQTFRVVILEAAAPDDQALVSKLREIAERLERVPGVTSVGIASSITMDGEDNGNPLYVEGVPVPADSLPPLRRFKTFAPGFFETVGNPLVAGRSITWTEATERRPVVVISETLAREYWQEPANAVGKRVRNNDEARWHEVVGVVGDERDDGLTQQATAVVYWPLLNDVYPSRSVAYAVRSQRAGAPGFVGELREAVWSVDESLPLAAVQTLEEIQARSMARTSFAMTMLCIAAGVALLIGVVGIYSAIAYVATQRTREVGVRMALGAPVAAVRRMFLRHGLWLTGSGIAIGVAVALALTRAMSALLFGVAATDPLTYAAVSLLLGAVALLATYLPALRASRVDPLVALRAGD